MGTPELSDERQAAVNALAQWIGDREAELSRIHVEQRTVRENSRWITQKGISESSPQPH